jgi:hypothetical protein
MKKTRQNRIIGWAFIINAVEMFIIMIAFIKMSEYEFIHTFLALNAAFLFLIIFSWMLGTGFKFLSKGK